MCPGRSALDPVGLVEAAYAWCDSDEDWLRGIAAAARALDAGSGVSARLDDVTDVERPRILAAVFHRFPDRPWARIMAEGLDQLPTDVARALYRAGPPVGFARDRLRDWPASTQRRLSDLFASWGWEDVFAIFARDVSGQVLHVDVPMQARRTFHSRTLHRLACVAAHFTSALRLRLGGRAAPDGPFTDAILEPGGAVRHALGEARRESVRARLSQAVQDAERARGMLRRSDPDAALAMWRGLVDGTWSLVDHWDSDGRRYVLARRNAPRVADPKALTDSERAIVTFLAMGHPEKYVAYLLGLAPSTVATQFASARRKLGVRSREGLVELLAPRLGYPARQPT